VPEPHPKPRKSSSLHRRINAVIFYSLLLLIVLSPIPFGSNRGWSWSLCALIISMLALVWVINATSRQANISLSLPPLIIYLFLVPCFWALIQVSTFMPENWYHPLWTKAAEALNTPTQPSISLTRDDTLTALMRLISYGLVFFLAFQFSRNAHRARSLLKWLAIAGVVYALYGLVVYWGNINVFFWIEETTRITSVSSTFVSRNSYVAYAGLGLICLMALSLSNSAHPQIPYTKAPITRLQQIESYIFNSWKPLLGLTLITAALFSTHSRGGAISGVIGISTLLLIYVIRTKVKAITLIGSLGGICLIILLAYSISNEALLERMTQVETGGSERITVFKITIDAIRDNPWAGFGYGGFDQVFKLYRNEDVQYIYDKAHNTYLENSFELGVPAAASLFMAMLGLMLLTLRGVFQRQRDWLYPATGLAATTLVASHSLVDFSLQIPAVAITYSAIMGLAVAQSFSSARRHAAAALRD
jgi:O-antigen ligase